MSGVLVVAETRRGELRPITFELLGSALALGNAPVRVLLIDADPAAHSGALSVPGIEEVLTVASPTAEFEAHVQAAAVAAVAEAQAPDVVLTGPTVDAMGYAPAVAARLGLGFASDVTAIEWPIVRRGAFGGRLDATLAFPDGPVLIMLRAGAHAAVAPGGGSAAVRAIDLPPDAVARTEHLGYRDAEAGDVDITQADVLVSIGRGVEDEDRIEELQALADALGATLTASRPLIDAGWLPASRQVGQSGRTVKPKVYLALGISGAVQHLIGMRDAETIIAVNTDPDAPIFGVADYGAVADLFEVAAALRRHAE
jgi:electron transfer flavoprotein alpha subunit